LILAKIILILILKRLAVSLVKKIILLIVLVAKYILFYFGVYCFVPINISCYDMHAIFNLVNFHSY